MDRNLKYQPQPQHRRKTPSFSSSLLDSILRSIDESNDESLHHQQQHAYHRDHDHDHDIRFFASEPKRSTKIYFPQTINGDEQMPSLRRAIMIDQWMETHNNNNNHHNGYVSSKSSRKFSSDSSSSGTTSSGSTETPSTYRSLPNSFTISRKTVEVDFRDDTHHHQQVNSINKREMKFMKSTRLKAMKIYGDLKKVKQPMSPGSRISAFLYSLFASSSSKKAKIEETMRSLKKSRSIKQDSTTTCTSFSRSCMSKKQRNSSVKRSVRFYPENDTVILDRKSIHERDPNLPKYERRWLQEKKYMKNYKSFMANVEDEDEDEDEDDLFELEIVGGLGNHVAYGQELPVFETTDLRKIRI